MTDTRDVKIEMQELHKGGEEVKKSPVAPEEEEKAYTNFYTWDYCLVFKVGVPEKMIKEKGGKEVSQKERWEAQTATAIHQIHKGGLKTTLYKSVQEDEIYCLVGAPERRLRLEADRVDYDLPLNLDACITYGNKIGLALTKTMEQQRANDPKSLAPEPWMRTYGKYETYNPSHPERQTLYERVKDEGERHENTFFKAMDRIRLTFGIIQADEVVGGSGLGIGSMIHDEDHPLIACFPLHQKERKDKLLKEWNNWWNLYNQPLNEIRDYYGEKIGMYFAFLGFYSKVMFFPAIFGLALFLDQMGEGVRVDIDALPAYGIAIALWATLFLEFWKRREATLRVEWGMTHFSSKEQPRPEFEGEELPDPVTGKMVKQFPLFQRLKRIMLSQVIIWTFIAGVLGCVVGIFLFRALLIRWSPSGGLIITSVVNAVQIQILNAIYGYISEILNEYENHRTPSEFENGLIAKSFIFKFVNSYNSLFYIAFFKQDDITVGGCVRRIHHTLGQQSWIDAMTKPSSVFYYNGTLVNTTHGMGFPNPTLLNPVTNKDLKVADFPYLMYDSKQSGAAWGTMDCMYELQTQLAIIFVLNIFVNNTIEIATPYIEGYFAARANAASDESGKAKPKTQPELEFELSPYESTFDDFDEMVVQYGFVTLFVVAFPLAPLCAMANNIIEIRLDATKISNFCRRPEPEGAMNIGTWFDILSIVSYISVITNSLLIVFRTEVIIKECGCLTKFTTWQSLVDDPLLHGVKLHKFPTPSPVNPEVDGFSGFVWVQDKSATCVVNQYTTFIVAEHLLLLIKFAVSYFIDDEPAPVRVHLARQEHLVDCLINGKEEENDDDLIEKRSHGALEFSYEKVPNEPDPKEYQFALR
jgi:hypothetical protein